MYTFIEINECTSRAHSLIAVPSPPPPGPHCHADIANRAASRRPIWLLLRSSLSHFLYILLLSSFYIFTFSYFSTSLQSYVHATPTAALPLQVDFLTDMTAIYNPHSRYTSSLFAWLYLPISSPGNTLQFLIHVLIPPPSPPAYYSHPQFIFISF